MSSVNNTIATGKPAAKLSVTKILDKVIAYLAIASGLVSLFITILTLADIIAREMLQVTIPGVYDLSQYLMVYIVFLSFAYCEQQGGNVKVDILFRRFSDKAQACVDIIGRLLTLFIFAMIVYTTGKWTWDAFQSQELMYGIKGGYVWPIKFGVPFGCFFILVYVVIHLVIKIKLLIGKSKDVQAVGRTN